MKVIIEAQNVSELKDIVQSLGDNELVVSLKSQAKIQSKPEVRIPRKYTHSPKKPYKKISGFVSKDWTPAEVDALRKWYMNPENHYANGDMIRDRLEAFAKSIGRTLNATQVRVVTTKINRTLVRGIIPSRHQKTFDKFPTLKTVQLEKRVLAGLFNQLIRDKRSLRFSEAGSYGITDQNTWMNFVYEVFDKGSKIAAFLEAKGNFRIDKEANGTIYLSFN